jgi:asparagine synthetase A
MVPMSVTAFYEKSSTDGDILVVSDPIDEIVGLFEIVTGLLVDGSAGTEDVADGDEKVVAVAVDELEEDVGIFEVLHGAEKCDRFL